MKWKYILSDIYAKPYRKLNVFSDITQIKLNSFLNGILICCLFFCFVWFFGPRKPFFPSLIMIVKHCEKTIVSDKDKWYITMQSSSKHYIIWSIIITIKYNIETLYVMYFPIHRIFYFYLFSHFFTNSGYSKKKINETILYIMEQIIMMMMIMALI